MAGRPSKYKKEFCEKLIEHMKQGLSFESFASIAGCNRSIVHDWSDRHKEFKLAKEIGESHSRLFWEKVLIAGSLGKVKGYNATSVIFALKNKFPKEWRDRREIEIESSSDNSLEDVDTETLLDALNE